MILPVIEVAAGCAVNERGEVLICQRPAGKIAAGKWEFPGGKIERGESPRQALARELHEELGLRVREAQPLIQVTHDYSDRRVILHVWRVTAWDGQPQPHDGQTFVWAAPAQLHEWDLLAADGPIVAALRLPAHYVFTPPDISEAALTARWSSLPAGALLRLRLPALNDGDYERIARRLITAGANLMLDRDPAQAAALGAAGWHASAARLGGLRQRPLSSQHWFAASCHSEDEIARARSLGVDFAVSGPVLATPTHPDRSPLGWERFSRLAEGFSRPLYAIGGVGPEHLAKSRECGAQGVAGIRAFWGR